MYISTAIGLGQPPTNQDSEQSVLKQLLKNGLSVNSDVFGNRVEIRLSPNMAKLPYSGKHIAAAREYWRLPEHDRKNITDIVDRVFSEATGISRKLDPKDPKDLPWIRTWLRLRDQVMLLKAKAPPSGDRGSSASTSQTHPQSTEGKLPPVQARILWPALGFPAVITPNAQPVAIPTFKVDATRCITILLLSNKPYLSKEEAARYLRYVPWEQRHRRQIHAGNTGSFREEDLIVRNDKKPNVRKGEWPFMLTFPGSESCKKDTKHCYGELVTFGANEDGQNHIMVNLAHYVRDFYRKQGIQFLHEIRISEAVSAKLQEGLYHLFWNNEAANEDAPSDEMALLFRKFVPSRRQGSDQLWKKFGIDPIKEYEREYGAIHAPYAAATPDPAPPRVEVLHPLFVQRSKKTLLKIVHITDTHVDIRANVYEENLRHSPPQVTYQNEIITYNNWNTSFVRVYNHAKPNADVILLTGDLIDYGRGHLGLKARHHLAEDKAYHVDRNWFLFYYLLAGGKSYTRPVYTILGNHDWRLNPYTPFAIAGAPSGESLIHRKMSSKPYKFGKGELDPLLVQAHGPGYKRIISYAHEIESKADLFFKKKFTWGSIGQFFRKVFGNEQTADLPGYPTETTIESVAWYLLTINPFLDYFFTHPGGQKILMLDWAEDENVFFEEISHGRKHGLNAIWLFGGDPGGEGPKARNCLTELQKQLVEHFTEQPGAAKVIGIHAPPIGPWFDWFNDELRHGKKEYSESETPRGSPDYARRTSDGIQKWNGHPFFAIRPEKRISSDPVWGMDASYNSFERHRPWFIKRIGQPRSGVRLVLSGHIHRNGLFTVYVAGKHRGVLSGQMLIQMVEEAHISSMKPPAVAKLPVESENGIMKYAPGPLYVNTTSAGPRGHSYFKKGMPGIYVPPGYASIDLSNDGTIRQVAFRSVPLESVLAPVASSKPRLPERQVAIRMR